MTGRDYMGIPREKLSWQPLVDPDKCIGCGTCLETCPNNVYVLDEEASKIAVSNPDNCVVLCDKCAGFCPEEAISFPDRETMKQQISKILHEMRNPQS